MADMHKSNCQTSVRNPDSKQLSCVSASRAMLKSHTHVLIVVLCCGVVCVQVRQADVYAEGQKLMCYRLARADFAALLGSRDEVWRFEVLANVSHLDTHSHTVACLRLSHSECHAVCGCNCCNQPSHAQWLNCGSRQSCPTHLTPVACRFDHPGMSIQHPPLSLTHSTHPHNHSLSPLSHLSLNNSLALAPDPHANQQTLNCAPCLRCPCCTT